MYNETGSITNATVVDGIIRFVSERSNHVEGKDSNNEYGLLLTKWSFNTAANAAKKVQVIDRTKIRQIKEIKMKKGLTRL